MSEMFLAAVRVELPSNTPVALLQEAGGMRTLPIYIGTVEATAIAYALQGVITPRPMTHDLMKDTLDALGATLEKVVVTELKDGTFYAEMHVVQGKNRSVISCRPSDALALAARTGSPILADDDLLDAEGVVIPVGMDQDDEERSVPEELVVQFREFIKDVRPEDFSS